MDGLPVLAHKYLPVFKVYAWCILVADKEAGKSVHGDEIKKHCRDVLRLCSLFSPNAHFELPETMVGEIAYFVERRLWDDNLLRNLRLDMTADEMARHISAIYCR